MKFRKKPILIDAFQFRSDWNQGAVAFPTWAMKAVGEGAIDLDTKPGFALIKTLEGVMTANDGDWIIRGIYGEFYPCKDAIFTASYDPI